ncbi:MAG: replicative DNA helicase [Oscillospiraceae bacterium]|jgi:replicative DNA helicase|nr:replicative DNA helicase [Oscillospiraceae bacterium]
MQSPFARIPPNNQDAERSVLGAMMLDREALTLGQELLRPDAFYQPAHKEIFDAMAALTLAGQPVDLVTLDAELARRGTLDGVGGLPALVALSQYISTTANARAYIQIVDEKHTLRTLIQAAETILSDAYSQSKPLEEILQQAERAIFDVAMKTAGSEALIHIRQILSRTYERIEKLFALKGAIDGVPTGFIDLDHLLTGFHPGELIIMGARPSMGKTSIGMNIVENAAVRAGKIAAVFSLEMPREQIAMRMLCSEAHVDMQAVRTGTLRDDDWLRLSTALGPLAASNMYIDDTPGLTPSQLRSRCRRLKIEHGLDLVMVDYLQLMGSDTKSESRQVEVSAISRALKGIAQELRVPLMACAQLSRANAARSDKRPMLSDLRDSGSIEQDADVVMFLHREEYYDPDTEDKNIAEVIVGKQRNGALGTVKLAWQGQYTRFANLEKQHG